MASEAKTVTKIHVVARKWFDSVNGNTYHSLFITSDGFTPIRVGMTYGYGRHYDTTALEVLQAAGIVPASERLPSGVTSPAYLSQWCRENGVEYTEEVQKGRKKDLHKLDDDSGWWERVELTQGG